MKVSELYRFLYVSDYSKFKSQTFVLLCRNSLKVFEHIEASFNTLVLLASRMWIATSWRSMWMKDKLFKYTDNQ